MSVKPAISLFVSAAILALGVPSAGALEPEGKPATASDGPSQPATDAPREEQTLDDELLKDLGPDALSGDQDAATAANRKGGKDAEAESLDRELLKGLNDGEDVGSPGVQNPLLRLSREMREVEAQMARQRSGDETRRLQSQIVGELEELIRQAQKPPQGGKSSSGGSSAKGEQKTASRRKVPQPGKRDGEGQSAGNAAARQSAKGTRKDPAQKPDMADMRDLLKGVWGQLPERQREQMLQSYEEQFLPKYEQMIADYFRSIAEERER